MRKKKPKPMLRWYKGPRPSSAIAPESDGRPVLATAWLRPKDEPGEWSMQATNSLTFVLLPVRIDDDERLRERAAASGCGAVPIPPKALLELERSRTAETFAIFEDDGSVTVGDTTFHPPGWWPSGKTEDGFPELPGSFPDPEALRREPKKRFELGFSAQLLRDAAAAMGQSRVKLVIDTSSPNVMFFFEALEGHGSAEAFVMPIRINV